MAKKVYGRVVDNANKAVEFAVVFVSDVNGKPIGNVSTYTDDKGRFVFNSLNDTDYITSNQVGLKPKTASVKDAVNVQSLLGAMPTLFLKMEPSAGVNLDEIIVKPEEDEPKPPKKDEVKPPKKDEVKPPKKDEPKKQEPLPKKGMSKNLKIGLIVGGSLLLLIIVGVIIYKSNKEE
jgi:hypothetical protein